MQSVVARRCDTCAGNTICAYVCAGAQCFSNLLGILQVCIDAEHVYFKMYMVHDIYKCPCTDTVSQAERVARLAGHHARGQVASPALIIAWATHGDFFKRL